MQSFDFEVLYSRADLNPADYISRHLQAATQCDLIAEYAEQYVNFVMTQATPKALSKDDIIKATAQDATLQEVMRLISNGQWNNLKPVNGVDPSTLKIFAKVWNELTSVDGNIVLRGNRIVIPDALQKRVIELAHEGHQGLVKTRSLLRSKVWFPKMDAAVDQVVKKCFPCQIATPKPSREPLKMTPLPGGPWQQVSIDFCEVVGHYVLVVIDDYSRFPEVEIGFKHRRVTPLWSEANGVVGRFMKTFGKVLRTTSNWKHQMYELLRNYRATPHCTTGVALATALF